MRFSLRCACALIGAGAVVGLLSGFFGVGGGFLIVPALMFVIRMDLPHAVGSSLAIIAMIGISSGALTGIPLLIAHQSLLSFFAGALLGMLVGRLVARKLAGPWLQRFFSAALICTGIIMMALNLEGGDDF